TPPINTFPWLENVFVGMTTGGSSNVAATFSKDFPSLWDFRPGDDAYDTILPYIDPYTGVVTTSVPCTGDINVLATVTKNSATITVADATNLQVGMYLGGANGTSVSSFPAQIKSITPNGSGGATIVLTSNYTGNTTGSGNPPVGPVTLTFTVNPPGTTVTITQIVAGSNQITVNSTAGLLIGQTIASTSTVDKSGTTIAAAALNVLNVSSTSNIGVGELVSGRSTTATGTTLAGSAIISVPSTTNVAIGELVSGTGIPAGATVTNVQPCPTAGVCSDPATLAVTMSAVATASGSGTDTFDASPFFNAATIVALPPTINNQVTISINSLIA